MSMPVPSFPEATTVDQPTQTPQQTVERTLKRTPNKKDGVASRPHLEHTQLTKKDLQRAHACDMKQFTEQGWLWTPYSDFYKDFYDATTGSNNSIADAVAILQPNIDKYRSKFAEFDKKTTEKPIYSEFVSLVNDILSLAAGTTAGLPEGRGVGQLRCYNTHNKHLKTRYTSLSPDVNIMEVPSKLDPPVASSSNPRPALQETMNTISQSTIPPASSTGDGSRTRKRRASAVLDDAENDETAACPDKDGLVAKDLKWWRVVVTMDVKPAHTPGKKSARISPGDRARALNSTPGVNSASLQPSQPTTPVAPSTALPQHPQTASSSTSVTKGSGQSLEGEFELPASKRLKLADGEYSPVGPAAQSRIAPQLSKSIGESGRHGSGIPSHHSIPLDLDPETCGDTHRLEEPASESPVLITADALANGSIGTLSPSKDDSQIGSYLTEVMSSTANRTHAFGCVLRGDLFHITYVDPQGMTQSERRKLSEQPTSPDTDWTLHFALFIYGLGRCQASKLGFDSLFTLPSGGPPRSLPATLDGLCYTVKGHKVTVLQTLYTERSLCGRHTRVLLVDFPREGKVQQAVLKLAYPYASRPREYDLLKQAEAILMQTMGHASGIPKVFLEDQGELVAQGFRKSFTTGLTRRRPLDRRLEILVMERLYPLHTLRTPLYIRGAEHIAETITALSGSNFYHRDISSGNLMLRLHPVNEDGKQLFEGVLSDFDLAVDQNSPCRNDAEDQHWTGTLPFLAQAVFEDPGSPHRVHFELESLFYVIIWDTCLWSKGMPVGVNVAEDSAGRKWIENWRDSERLIPERGQLPRRLNPRKMPKESLLNLNVTFKLWQKGLYKVAYLINQADAPDPANMEHASEDDADEQHPTLGDIQELLTDGQTALKGLPLGDQASFEPCIWEHNPIPDWQPSPDQRPIKVEEPSDVDLHPDLKVAFDC